ncbi:MAG: hypothetical protein ACJA1P_000225 [Maribacter sp.]|jgi:hypothetical protein
MMCVTDSFGFLLLDNHNNARERIQKIVEQIF